MQSAILILAAGHSRRFRQANREHKLLALLNDKPVLQHTLEQASATGMDVYVVTRPGSGSRITSSPEPVYLRDISCLMAVDRPDDLFMGHEIR